MQMLRQLRLCLVRFYVDASGRNAEPVGPIFSPPFVSRGGRLIYADALWWRKRKCRNTSR